SVERSGVAPQRASADGHQELEDADVGAALFLEELHRSIGSLVEGSGKVRRVGGPRGTRSGQQDERGQDGHVTGLTNHGLAPLQTAPLAPEYRGEGRNTKRLSYFRPATG